MEMRLGLFFFFLLSVVKTDSEGASPSAVQALSLSVYHRNVCGCVIIVSLPSPSYEVPWRCRNVSDRRFVLPAATPFGSF